MKKKNYTEAGTDIDEVKKLNAASGLSYNKIKELLAQASEVQKVDEIPNKQLKGNSKL